MDMRIARLVEGGGIYIPAVTSAEDDGKVDDYNQVNFANNIVQ